MEKMRLIPILIHANSYECCIFFYFFFKIVSLLRFYVSYVHFFIVRVYHVNCENFLFQSSPFFLLFFLCCQLFFHFFYLLYHPSYPPSGIIWFSRDSMYNEIVLKNNMKQHTLPVARKNWHVNSVTSFQGPVHIQGL